MRVCLVYVGIGVAGMQANRPLGDREGSWISHGVASIGAVLKEVGHAVKLIDMRRLGGWVDLVNQVREARCDVFCLSVSAVDYEAAMRVILAIRQNVPRAKVLVGGIHPTIFPHDYEYADCVVTGEGEVTIPKLIRDIEAGSPLPKRIVGEKPDLDKLPWVARELFDYRNELACAYTPDQETPAITMLAGRGCPFRCTYCQPAESAVFGHPYRLRSVDNVIGEMQALKERYHYRSVTFWDDTFTFKKSWVMEFCDKYERSGINAKIAACSRADIICRNEDMIARLAEVGLDWFVIGFESGSQRILDLLKKGCTVEQNLEAARICRKYGIKIFATYMYGLPTETEEEVLMTARMMDEIAPEHPSPFWFLPIKGTDAYTYCAENDLILPQVKDRTIERTGRFQPALKGINYDHIARVMQGARA